MESQIIELLNRFQVSSKNGIILLQFSLFFFAGASLHQLQFHKSTRTANIALALGLTIAGLVLALGEPFLALLIAVPIATVVIGNSSTPVLRRTGRYGDLSFGIYIYAFPVQQTVIWLYGNHLPWWIVLIISIATTVAMAFLSWHLVEKWALQLKHRFSGT